MAPEDVLAPAPDDSQVPDQDDTLTLLFLCCHPALSPASQLALTLRAVGGLTTAQVARAFLVHGPQAGLDLLRTLDDDERMAGHHRLHAVRAHLLEMAGELDAARTSYRTAARGTTSLPEQRYLESRAARLKNDDR